MSTKLTRQAFFKIAGVGAAWMALASTLGCEPKQARSGHARTARPKHARSSHSPSARAKPDVQTFCSRPDLGPPTVEVTTQAQDTAPGYIFVAPKKGPGQYGPMILDDSGRLVWFLPLKSKHEYAMDCKVQRYRGEPVLTWWEGKVHGFGRGEYVILDGSYREVARVRAGNGFHGDHHEFLITPQDTALFTIYNSVRMDLSPLGGSEEGWVLDGIVQEVDIATGEVFFEWHSLEHVDFDESYEELSKDSKWSDYFHINSIDIDHDANLLVSAKGTFTVYKVDRKSGEVIWRLGGKESSFDMGPGTRTAYQHDARRQPDGTITIFDNGAAPKVHNKSRGIVVELDEEEMTATLVREYTHPENLLAGSQANMQVLPNGNVFVGWGSEPFFSEFAHDGELLFSASFPPRDESYRAFRFPWSGHPSDKPAMMAERSSNNEVTLYASWNGATEVAAWEVLAGPSRRQLRPVGSAPRDGFEAAITVRTAEPFIGVRAKDRSGRVLGTARAVKREN